MIRLYDYSESYKDRGLCIEQCGLLFLGTPHSGSTSADCNKFISNLTTLFGVRADILDNLRPFNGFAVASKEAFGRIKPCPPYRCLCETERTRVAGKLRLVSH
jgi:hypothetical protein